MRLPGAGMICVLLLMLLGCTEPPNEPSKEEVSKKGGEVMTTELILAAERGETGRVLALLESGIDINATDAKGRTAILAATHSNKPDTVKALIDAGADFNLRDQRNDNPLLYAGAEGRLEIVKLMVEAGADTSITNRFGGTSLIPAADRGHVEVVEYLLQHSDVDIDHINDLGWTALLEAVILGDGVTPLQHAMRRDYQPMVAILEQAGAK